MEKVAKLETLKKTIETLNKYHQVEILKILTKNLCKINENKSGCYVNMSFLNEEFEFFSFVFPFVLFSPVFNDGNDSIWHGKGCDGAFFFTTPVLMLNTLCVP